MITHEKRFFSLLLVLILAASALNITAFAYSDYKEGYYQGKTYIASVSCTKIAINSRLEWNAYGTKSVYQVVYYYNYKTKTNETIKQYGEANNNVTSVYKNWKSSGFQEATSVTSTCRLKGTLVYTLTAKPGY
ncbi:MAG: hypothetical protein IIY94_06250 [Oscillospiraceae bacterium]|nr:hypothetical protein [Oscillospiraceae bacterium]